MPKAKPGTKYQKIYDESKIQEALKAVENGMSKRQAALTFNIPRSTIQFRLSQNFSKIQCGPPTVLTPQEEQDLILWIEKCSRKGFPRRMEDIQMSVKFFLDTSPRPNPFVNNFPGKGWYQAFLRRHKQLTMRTAEAVTPASANVTESDIRGWFRQIEAYLKEKTLFDILQDGERVFNGDETNFQLCPKSQKVLAVRGTKNVYEVDQAPAKSTLTVMFSFSASGETVPPMIIFPYKRLPDELIQSSPDPSWGFGKSDNGWMKAEVFYEYISNVFNRHLIKNNIKRPVILFVDGHKTHLTYNLSTLCTSLQIILIALYPNSTRILQPADVAAFKPIKTQWKKSVTAWHRENPNQQLTMKKFAGVLYTVIQTIKSQTLQNGFRACGLCPFNPDALDFSKCLGKEKTHVAQPTNCGVCDETTLSFLEFKQIVGENEILEAEVYEGDECELKSLIKSLTQAFKHKNAAMKAENQNDLRNNSKSEEEAITSISESQNVAKSNQEADEATFETINFMDIPIDFVGIEENEINLDNLIVEENKKTNSSFILKENKVVNDNSTVENLTISEHKKTNNCPSVTLADLLLYPDTPVRKGKRTSEKEPFVITSSVWKSIKEAKANAKKDELRKKEERRVSLIEKRKEKERKALENVTKKNNRVTKEKHHQEASKKKAEVHSKKINILSDIVVNKSSSVKDSSNQKKLSSEKSHVRFLFQDEIEEEIAEKDTSKETVRKGIPKGKIIEDITYTMDKDFKNNERVFSGMCYICTRNVNESYEGIKCTHCTRTFHPACIRKHNNIPPVTHSYMCRGCIKKIPT